MGMQGDAGLPCEGHIWEEPSGDINTHSKLI